MQYITESDILFKVTFHKCECDLTLSDHMILTENIGLLSLLTSALYLERELGLAARSSVLDVPQEKWLSQSTAASAENGDPEWSPGEQPKVTKRKRKRPVDSDKINADETCPEKQPKLENEGLGTATENSSPVSMIGSDDYLNFGGIVIKTEEDTEDLTKKTPVRADRLQLSRGAEQSPNHKPLVRKSTSARKRPTLDVKDLSKLTKSIVVLRRLTGFVDDAGIIKFESASEAAESESKSPRVSKKAEKDIIVIEPDTQKSKMAAEPRVRPKLPTLEVVPKRKVKPDLLSVSSTGRVRTPKKVFDI